MQSLWIDKLGWDDPVSPQTAQHWTKFREELSQLSSISVPRWLGLSTNSKIEIHGFSDASQVAMAAVVFLRVKDTDSDTRITFVCSKTRVAPLKKLTISRLELSAAVLNDGTEWKFNPPGAPHFGGKWEAAVKSVKFHLKRTIGDSLLTFEELSTLLSQIEAVLNSRPLEPLSEDPDDLTALTPGHFLIGEAQTTVPEPSLDEGNLSRLSRWQLIQQKLQSFWKHWSSGYIQQLQSTSKWHHRTSDVKIGSLVLLSDERFPASKWPLARVLSLQPGSDGLTRVVTLKTATTTLKRPITKLVLLPVPVLPDVM